MLTQQSSSLCASYISCDSSDAVIEAFRQPAIKQPYVMRSLAMPTYDVTKVQKSDELVNRSFWWEVLCVVRSRPPYVTEKTIEVVDDPSVRVSHNR